MSTKNAARVSSRWWLPALAAVVFAVLVGFGINGSSIGILYAPTTDAVTGQPSTDPDLILGQPRIIRTDEWAIATPTAVSQTLQGFPDLPWIGLTRTNPQTFPYSLPTVTPALIAKPQIWGYLALGPVRGLAWSWWFPFLLASVSLYLLVEALTRRVLLSAAVAMIGAFTPFVAWWTAPSPNLMLGFACLIMFAGLRGLTAASMPARIGWGVLMGWAATASVLVLYPPWMVSTMLVAAAFLIGAWADLRTRLLRAVQVLAGAGVTAAVLLAPWYLGVAEAFRAINATIYPGMRRSGSGESVWQVLFSAPANLVASVRGHGPAILNQSEVASSWIPLLLLVLLVPLFFSRGQARDDDPRVRIGRWTALTLTAVLALLLVWMLVPGVPQILGKITLLNRVPGVRLPMAIGFAILLLAVVMSRLDLHLRSHAGLRVAVVVIAGLSALVVTGIGHWMYPEMGRAGLLATAAGGFLVTMGIADVATGLWRHWAVFALAAYSAVSFAVVNPVYRGLGPLADDAVAQYAGEHVGETAVTLGGRELQALVRGGGMQVLSWTTEYPDRAFWEKVMPGGEAVWNNYRNYSWSYDPAASPIDATVIAMDAAELRVDLCDPVILGLEYTRVFSDQPLNAPCLTPDATLRRGDTEVLVYRRV